MILSDIRTLKCQLLLLRFQRCVSLWAMRARIPGLKKYQGRNPNGYFQDLNWPVRQRAYRWLALFTRRWGRNLPQWRFAILVGQAKRLALNQPTSAWGGRCLLRGVARQCSGGIGTKAGIPPRSQPRSIVSRLECVRKMRRGRFWVYHPSPASRTYRCGRKRALAEQTDARQNQLLIRPLREPSTIGKALADEEQQRLLKTAAMWPEWETAYLAAILCLNTTARGCELKGLQWSDVDLFAKTLTIRRSKTAAGVRTVPLTDVAASALGRLRVRAEGFGTIEPSHYVFAAFVPKFKLNGKRMVDGVIDYKITAFDPTRNLKSWRSAWRTLTKKAGLPGFRFHDLRHCAITQLAENGASDSTIMAIAGHVSRRMLERYSHVRMEAKRTALEALAAEHQSGGL